VDGKSQVLAPPERTEQGVTEYEFNSLPQVQTAATSLLAPIDVAWLLWRKRKFLVRFSAAGAALFIVIALVWPKRYTASATLMPPDYNTMSQLALSLPGLSSDSGEGGGNGGGGNKGAGLMGLASQLLGLNSSGQLFVGVLQSRTVQRDLISKFDLMKRYGARYPEDAQKLLDKNTEIKVDDKTGMLGISVEDNDANIAAAMVQTYIDDLNKVLGTVNISSAHRERLFIEKRRAEVKQDLDEAAKQFSEFASANAAIDIPEQAKAMVAAGADMQAQLIEAQSMLSGLQQIYTDNNPRVRGMKAQVAELERQVNTFGGKGVTPSNGSVLNKNDLYPSVRQLPLLGVRYLELYRQSKINESVYELLTKQYEIARLQEARDVPTAQVLDAPLVPQKKTSPRRTLMVLFGTLFTFLAGVTGLIGQAYWIHTDPQLPWKLFFRELALVFKRKTWDSLVAYRTRRGIARIIDRLTNGR